MPTNYAENAHKVLQKKISPSSRIVGMSTVVHSIYYVILIGKRGVEESEMHIGTSWLCPEKRKLIFE